MTESKHTPWVRHLDAIGDELLHLSIACDVKLREPGVDLVDDAPHAGHVHGPHPLRDLAFADVPEQWVDHGDGAHRRWR